MRRSEHNEQCETLDYDCANLVFTHISPSACGGLSPPHTCFLRLFKAVARRVSVLFGGWHKEDLSHLDRKTARFRALAGPCHRLVHVCGFQYPKPAHMLFGLQVWPIGEEQFTVGLRPQRVGRAQPTSELPDTSSDHFAIERVNLLHY